MRTAQQYLDKLRATAHTGVMQVAGVHGGGSPIMEKIAIMAQYDIGAKKKIAKYLAGMED